MTKTAWQVLEPRNLELGPKPGGAPAPWKNWTLTTDEDRIAWLVIDRKDSSTNTLNEGVIAELGDVLAAVEREQPAGLVIRSGKSGGFIAGADISEFRGITDASQIEAQLTRAHAVIDRLERLQAGGVGLGEIADGDDRGHAGGEF